MSPEKMAVPRGTIWSRSGVPLAWAEERRQRIRGVKPALHGQLHRDDAAGQSLPSLGVECSRAKPSRSEYSRCRQGCNIMAKHSAGWIDLSAAAEKMSRRKKRAKHRHANGSHQAGHGHRRPPQVREKFESGAHYGREKHYLPPRGLVG